MESQSSQTIARELENLIHEVVGEQDAGVTEDIFKIVVTELFRARRRLHLLTELLIEKGIIDRDDLETEKVTQDDVFRYLKSILE